MADAALSSKSAATALAGTELLYCVQSGATVYATPTQLDAYTSATTRELVNKTINASSNTITNLATTHFASGVIDTSTSLSSNSDTKLATQKATKAYVDAAAAACAQTSGTLAQFAATTSAQLRGVLSDETGTGAAVFATSPTLVTPVLGVASATSITADAHIKSSSAIITDSSTARTLSAGDNGKTIYFTNASAITVSMASGLGAGFSCSLWQGGAGQIFFDANGQTMTIERGYTNSTSIGARVYVEAPAANTFLISGALTTIASPLVISGCVFWIDAADGNSVTQSAGVISQVNDKSGSGFHVTATSTAQPTYRYGDLNGRNVIRFDGTANLLKNTSATLLRSVAGWSIFSVHRTSSITTARNVMAIETGPGATRAQLSLAVTTGFRAVGGRRLDAAGLASAVGSTQTGTGFTQWSGIGDYTNTTATLFVDGAQDAINSSWLTSGNSDNTGGNIHIGNGVPGSTTWWSGDIAEQVIFNTALSTANRKLMEAYFRAKWGLS